MTVLDDTSTLRPVVPVPPTALSVGTSRRSGNRLAARLAWREVRRRKGRTSLVVLLIAAPTMALVLASAVARTEMTSSLVSIQRGDADVVVNGTVLTSDEPTSLDELPAGSTTISYLKVGVPIEPTEPIETPFLNQLYVELTNIPLDNLDTMGIVEVTDGTAPRPGELLLSADAAEQLGVDVGEQLSLRRPSGTWTVSGIGRYSYGFHYPLLLIPDFDPARLAPGSEQYESLIFLPAGTPDAEAQAVAQSAGGYWTGIDVAYADYTPETGQLALGWLIAAMAFMAFGIVIAAAFATSARSQLVTVGQLSANGAPTRLIKRVLAWQGMWSGAIGASIGSVAGLMALPFLHGPAEGYFFSRSISWVVAPLDIVVIALTAIVAGLVAAAIPARSLATTSVLSALAGRRPALDVPRWMAPLGLLLVGGGTGLMVLSLMATESTNGSFALTAATLLGGVGLALGTCCLSPVIVAQFSRLAGRLPLAGRLSLRGMSRSRGRSAAVISAIAVTVGIAVAGVSVTERELDASAAPSTAPLDILTLRIRDTRYEQKYDKFMAQSDIDATTGEFTPPAMTSFELPEPTNSTVPAAALDRITEIFPNATITPLRAAVHPGGQVDISDGDDPWSSTAFSIPIASEATIEAGDWPPEARDVLAAEGFAGVVHPERGMSNFIAGNFDLSTFAGFDLETFGIDSAPLIESYDTLRFGYDYSFLMTDEFASGHGLAVVDVGVIIDNDSAITREQRDQLGTVWPLLNGDEVARSPFIEPGDDPAGNSFAQYLGAGSWNMSYEYVDFDAMRNLWITRIVALGAALLLVGIVVAIGLALAAADNKAERDVFAIVGARPSSLRRMAAGNALTMTVIGIAVGIPVGFLPTWAIVRAVSVEQTGVPFPWLFVVALAVILPATMMLMAWTASAAAVRLSNQPVTRSA